MPDVIIEKRRYYNPVDMVFRQIGGTWKVPVLWRLKNRPMRYKELQQDIPHISQRMLTQALKELEKDGFIHKKVFAEVPPRTEYTLTEKGSSAIPIIETIRNYGLRLMKDMGIDYDDLVKAEKQEKRP